MQSALWVSKTGLSAQDVALRTISNNLANVSTVGFRAALPVLALVLGSDYAEPRRARELLESVPGKS